MSQDTLRTQRTKKVQRTRKVIDFLKIKRKAAKPTELHEKTGIPERSLFRILKELEALGLAKKREDGYWVWSEYNKPYDTAYAREQAVNHSQNLLPGFTALFEQDPQSLLNYRENKTIPKGPRYEFDEPGDSVVHQRIRSYVMSDFLEEHLQTGYPDIYKSLEDFRKSWVKFEKLRQSKIGKTIEKLQSKMVGNVSIEIPDRVLDPKIPNCPQHFGYLHEIKNNVNWPKECWDCPKHEECMHLNENKTWFRKIFPEYKHSIRNDIPYVIGPFKSKEEITRLRAYNIDYRKAMKLKGNFEKSAGWYIIGPVHMPPTFNEFFETQKLMPTAYGKLGEKLLELKIKVESGNPLAGDCRACPNITIKNNGNSEATL